MGEIVGAFGTAHIVMAKSSGGAEGDRVFAGMQEIGRRARALAPHVLVIVSSDHFYNYHADETAAFALAPAPEHVPFGDMHLPQAPFAGHAPFARGLLDYAHGAGFPLDPLKEYRPDHGVVIPALLIDKAGRTPVVPIITNTGLNPAPSLADGWRLGGIVRDYVATRPAGERVVVVGTGGLSHWLGVPEMGRINPAFDASVLDALTMGSAQSLIDWSPAAVRADGGNGGLEIVNWMVMAGAAGGAAGERVYYEEVPAWITGMGGVQLFPAREAA